MLNTVTKVYDAIAKAFVVPEKTVYLPLMKGEPGLSSDINRAELEVYIQQTLDQIAERVREEYVAKSKESSVVYGTDQSGTQITIPYTLNKTAGTIPVRNANGTFKVGDPVSEWDALNWRFAEARFVPLIKPTEKNVYYFPALSVNNDNSVSYWSIKATPEPSGEKVVIRSKQGRAQMQDPVDAMDIANKRSVEQIVNTAVQKIVGLAPDELDTLEELAAHIKSHADEYAVIVDAVLKKADTDFVKGMQQTVDVITSQDDGFDILYSSDVEVTLPIRGGDGVVADVGIEGDIIELRIDPTYVQYLNRAARAIITPLTAPAEPVIPVIGTNNAQQNVELGDGFSIKDGKLVSTKNYPKFVRLF